MKQRKPILIIDDSSDSQRIKEIFHDNGIDYVEYHIKKFEESCCGELPTTKAPSVIAVEGIYKEEDKIKEYINTLKKNKRNHYISFNKSDLKNEDIDSSYW
jgi:hypothetical protein